jgi:hypothetical protein
LFSSPSLNNINIFSLNNKTTNILTPFHSIFWFRPWLTITDILWPYKRPEKDAEKGRKEKEGEHERKQKNTGEKKRREQGGGKR